MNETPPMVHDTAIPAAALHHLRDKILVKHNYDVPDDLPVELTLNVNGDVVIGTFGDLTYRVQCADRYISDSTPAAPAPDPDITMTWAQFSAVAGRANTWSGSMHLRADHGVIVGCQPNTSITAYDRAGTVRLSRATEKPWRPPEHMFGAGNEFTALPV